MTVVGDMQDWVFPVMWTTLYILMGISSWLVWKEGGKEITSTWIYFFYLEVELQMKRVESSFEIEYSTLLSKTCLLLNPSQVK